VSTPDRLPPVAPNGLAWCLAVPARFRTIYDRAGIEQRHAFMQDVQGGVHEVNYEVVRACAEADAKAHRWDD
jgi:hypothetical protein